MQLTQTVSKFSGKRIYVDEQGFRYASISTLANFFGSTWGLYNWNFNLGKEIAANQGLEGLTNNELYKLGRPEGDRICNEAAELGTAVHEIIETSEPSGNPELDAYYEQYKTHIAPHLEIHHQEIVLGHVTPDGLRMAGTCDLLGAWKGEDIVGDWKTSPKKKKKTFMGSYALQLAAYSIASPQQSNKGIIFNLCPDAAHIFYIPLEEPKRMLLEMVLPNFYSYYREYGHVDKRDRPFPNQYHDLGNILSSFEKDLAKTITVE